MEYGCDEIAVPQEVEVRKDRPRIPLDIAVAIFREDYADDRIFQVNESTMKTFIVVWSKNPSELNLPNNFLGYQVLKFQM